MGKRRTGSQVFFMKANSESSTGLWPTNLTRERIDIDQSSRRICDVGNSDLLQEISKVERSEPLDEIGYITETPLPVNIYLPDQ